MICYSVCGLALGSEVLLPELEQRSNLEPQCLVRLRSGSFGPIDPYHQIVTPAGQVFLALARTSAGYLARFPGLADYELQADGRVVWCQPVPGTGPEIYRQLLLGPVLPLLLTLRGQLVLHASGIVTPAGAALFIGPTGSGKSTLAASLGRQGHDVLADDCVVLQERDDGWHAFPSLPLLSLRADVIPALGLRDAALTEAPLHPDKRRLLPTDDAPFRFATQAVAIRLFYFLAPPAESAKVTITPCPARAAFHELVKNAFHLDVTDAGAHSRRFQQLTRLAALPSLRWLAYPRELAALPVLRQAILADAAAGSDIASQALPNQ